MRDSKREALRQKALADLATLEQALDMYRLDNLRFPTSEQGLQALVSKPMGDQAWVAIPCFSCTRCSAVCWKYGCTSI